MLDWIYFKLVFVSGWCPIHALWIKVRCWPIHLLVCFLFQILVDHLIHPQALNLSFVFLYAWIARSSCSIYLRPSLKSRQQMDLSVQSNPWIWFMVPVDTTFSKLEAMITMFQGQRWAQCRFPGTHAVPHHEVDFVRIVKKPSCLLTDVEKISLNHFNGPCSFFDAWLHVKMH